MHSSARLQIPFIVIPSDRFRWGLTILWGLLHLAIWEMKGLFRNEVRQGENQHENDDHRCDHPTELTG